MMSSYTYDEYVESVEKNEIIDEFLYDNGFVYIKDNIESYGIRASFTDDRVCEMVFDDLYPYMNKEKLYFLINGSNKTIYNTLLNKGFTDKYTAYEMTYSGEIFWDDNLELKPYHSDEFESYINVLGAFTEMRKKLDLEPFDWYLHNQEDAKIKFDLHKKDNNIFGYWQENELQAVAMLDHNEIDTIAVRRDVQKKGIGKKLLKTLIMLLNDRGYLELYLSVMAINKKAITLYESLGFQTRTALTVLEK